MNPQERAQYDAARQRLDGLYAEIEAVRDEFRDLVSQMASQLLSQENA